MRKTAYAVILSALMLVSFVAGRHHTHAPADKVVPVRRILFYVDPMHPAYKSDHPGIAPDCGMKLEPVYADAVSPATDSDAPSIPLSPGSITIDYQKQQLIGLATAVVQSVPDKSSLRVPGRVQPDDTRIYRVSAGVDGWLRETFDSSIGSHVSKDQKLASFSSPDFVALEQGYLVATERVMAGVKAAQAAPGTRSTSARLRNLGMSDVQIRELGESRQMPENIDVVSPVDGFIVSRNVSSGQKFERGAEFYRIADLSHVWIMADVYERDAQRLRPGTVAVIRSANLQRTFKALVSDTLPQFDPVTRTMKLRLEADNPGFALRPDMFVDVDLPVSAPAGLSVPVDAIIDSGTSQYVFVDLGQDLFQRRQVETSWHAGNRVGIIKGVVPGEKVVVSGTFLVDSESRLRAAAQPSAATPRERVVPVTSAPAAHLQPISNGIGQKNLVTKDPKCGMGVDRAASIRSGNTLQYGAATYYFCSKHCKDEFSKQPQKYLATQRQAEAHD